MPNNGLLRDNTETFGGDKYVHYWFVVTAL